MYLKYFEIKNCYLLGGDRNGMGCDSEVYY